MVVEARLLLGYCRDSDGADGGSCHGNDEGWKGQGTVAKAVGGGRTGTQGTAAMGAGNFRARLGGKNAK